MHNGVITLKVALTHTIGKQVNRGNNLALLKKPLVSLLLLYIVLLAADWIDMFSVTSLGIVLKDYQTRYMFLLVLLGR